MGRDQTAPRIAVAVSSAMRDLVTIRRFAPGDEPALFQVYFTAIHLIASRDYTAEQVDAWAPRDLDMTLWNRKIREINPFVAVSGEELVGYADVQLSGYIDHFFVSGNHPRRGIGTLLMTRVLEEARASGVRELTSDVSRTAQPFFAKFGFVVLEQRQPIVRGVVCPNARMRTRPE